MTKYSERELQGLLSGNPDLGVEGEIKYQQPQEKFFQAPPDAVRPHKYRAEKTTVNGITFASKREANYYGLLLSLQDAGQIRELVLQPRFILQEKFTDTQGRNHRAIEYVADFQYIENTTGKTVVIDVKGFPTPVFKLKMKLFLHRYPAIEYHLWH